MQSDISAHSANKPAFAIGLALTLAAFVLGAAQAQVYGPPGPILRALGPAPSHLIQGGYYVPSNLDTIQWGSLPNRDARAVITVPSGSSVTFDTVSHEGILEDQGRDPDRFFAQHGVGADQVLDDAKAIAGSRVPHDFDADGPHIVTGPVAIEGAMRGDVLKIEVLSLRPRVPYGVISNRHGKGALPGEFPENGGRENGASAARPELYNNVSVFTEVVNLDGVSYALLHDRAGDDIRFPIAPFLGIMGVAPDTTETVNSIPPDVYGGNLDINELGAGSTLYLPIQVPGALFYVGDPHYAQGDGEVALTALEAPLRAELRLTVLSSGDPAIPGGSPFSQPFAETDDYWIPIGIDPDLDEAMKEAVRGGIDFLSTTLGVDRAVAYAYMSAATDFEVSQVVDRNKGVHGLIRKSDFEAANP
jgi:acetamidase/formamidase